MSVDPMATKYASYSAYHYSYNNPVMFNDPSGADGSGPGPGYYDGNSCPQCFVGPTFDQMVANDLMQSYQDIGMGDIYANYVATNAYVGQVKAAMDAQYASYKSATGYVQASDGNWYKSEDYAEYAIVPYGTDIFVGDKLLSHSIEGYRLVLVRGGNVPPGEYKVKKGETLYSLAKRFKLSVSELKYINGIGKSNKIHVGQRLKVDRAFVDFGRLMNKKIEYQGETTRLGKTPLGSWLRSELDYRRGFVNGNWVDWEYEWRSLAWVNYVPNVLNLYIHVYSDQWRKMDWSLRAYAFDRFSVQE